MILKMSLNISKNINLGIILNFSQLTKNINKISARVTNSIKFLNKSFFFFFQVKKNISLL